MQSAYTLPTPPESLLVLSHRLSERIIDAIRSDGPMPFDQYMSMCLYEPGLGYYVNGLHKFGQAGDFVTSPEQGPLFAQTLARQIDDISLAWVSPAMWHVLELGAGSGVLARDILLNLKTLPEKYWIFEPSAVLREVQAKTLEAAGLLEHVEWLAKPPEQDFCGVVLGNEVIDALPIKRWCLSGDVIEELAVDLDQNGSALCWTRIQPSEALEAKVSTLLERLNEPVSSGYESECCVYLEAWLASVTAHLTQGVVLLIDYGYTEDVYYHPERSEGTLVCHYRHRAHFDPFVWPGLTDISAWVDFSALGRSADNIGLEVMGYTTQAEFVLAQGIHHDVMALTDENARLSALSELKRLTLPGEMGEKFKVMALARGDIPQLRGFSGSIE